LANLDTNFATPITLGNTAVQLGNTITTINSVTLVTPTINTITSGSGSNLVLQSNNAVTAVTIDTSQNVGVGVTPSAWFSGWKAIQFGSTGSLVSGSYVGLSNNIYTNASGNPTYLTSSYGTLLDLNSTGQFVFYNSPSGTAGATATLTQAMTLDNSNHLFIGTTSALINESTLSAVSSGNTVAFKATGNAGNNPLLLWNNAASGTISLISFFYNTSYTSAGSITTNGTVTTLNQPSDYRLKNVTGELTTSGFFIDALQPKVGTFKSDGSPFVGFIADEVQLVSPSSVQGTKDATREEQYEVTPAVRDEQGNITIPAVMGTRTVPLYQSMAYDSPEIMANIIAELKSLRARLKAANIA